MSQPPKTPRGNRLSYSEIRTMLACSAKWKFAYYDTLPSPRTVNQVFGTAVHETLAGYFRQKLETNREPPLPALLTRFRQEWEAQLSTLAPSRLTGLGEADNPLLLESLGETLIEEYVATVSPDLKPIVVEGRLEGRIGNIPLIGYVDVIATEGTGHHPKIIDLKTAGRSPGGISEDHRMQLTLYGLLYLQNERLFPLPPLEAELHVLNKAKAVVEFYRTTLNQADYTYVEQIVPRVAKAIMSGNYYPNRSHMYCSKKNCSFWESCIQRYGGQVRD